MRYTTKPTRVIWRGDDPDYPSQTADQIIEEDVNTFIGLVDHNGREIHRERQPFGFVARTK